LSTFAEGLPTAWRLHAFAEQEYAQQDLAVALWQTFRDLAVQLSKFKQGGPWDAERISSIHAYVAFE
jgi:hypothetical protein